MMINIKTLSVIKPDEIKKYLKTLSLTVMLPCRMVSLLMMHCRQMAPGHCNHLAEVCEIPAYSP